MKAEQQILDEAERLRRENAELKELNHLILSGLRWTGDGYEWTGAEYDYRINPEESVRLMAEERKRLRDKIAACEREFERQ